ncbi:hypothetical protein MW887_000003 [Aspergillus wentii]|nr:hypothetical protein MW887_000003 [Aspergillus wentii]
MHRETSFDVLAQVERRPLTLSNLLSYALDYLNQMRFFATCFLYGAAFHIWSSSVLVQFDDTLDSADIPRTSGIDGKIDDQGKNEGGRTHEHRLEESDDEDVTFIPLGWPRLREAEFYAASDPEWQQFIKISQDRQKLQSLRDELATLALGNASRSTLLSHMLGGPLTIAGFWLVHHFPSRSPPEYGRPGLEIGDNYISLVSRRMSSEESDRLRRFMCPIFVALAINDAFLVFMKRKLSRFQNSDFYQGTTRGDPVLRQPDKTFPPDLQHVDGLSHVSRPETQLPLSRSSQGDVPQGNEKPRLHPSSIISSLQRLPLPKLGPDSDLYVASIAFKWKLNDCWAHEAHTPRRGTFYVAGPVGLKGPKGFCRIEVRGEYDPGTSSWTNVSMHLKDLNVFHQRALGGRK